MWLGWWNPQRTSLKVPAGQGDAGCLKEVCFGSSVGLCVLGSPQKAVCSVKANRGYYDAITGVSCGMLKTQEKCAPGEGRRKSPRET